MEVLDGYLVIVKLPSAPLPDGHYQYVYVSGTNGIALAVSEHRIVGSGPPSLTSSLSTNQSADMIEPRVVDNRVDGQRWESALRLAMRFAGNSETDDLGQLKDDVMLLYEFVSEMQFKMLRNIQRVEEKRDHERLIRQELDERNKEVAQLQEQIRQLSVEKEQLQIDKKEEEYKRLRLQEENDRMMKYGLVYKNYVDDQSKAQPLSDTDSTVMSTGESLPPCNKSSGSIHPEANHRRQQTTRAPWLIFRAEKSTEQGHMGLPPEIPIHASPDQVGSSSKSSSSQLQPGQQSREFQENYRAEFDDRRTDAAFSASNTEVKRLVYHSTVHAAQAPVTAIPNVPFLHSYQTPSVATSGGISERLSSVQHPFVQTSHCSVGVEVPQAVAGMLPSQPYRDVSPPDDLVFICPVCNRHFCKTTVGQNEFERHVHSHFSD